MSAPIAIPARFSIQQLCFSQTAERDNIDNAPSKAQLENLYKLQAKLVEVEALLGHPIWVSSGFRSNALNEAIGGSKTSDHSNGLAADWSCPDYGTPLTVCLFLKDKMTNFDQLIYEGAWIHLGIGARMRHELLTVRFSKGADGKRRTVYEKGINP